MKFFVCALILAPLLAQGAILPDAIGPYQKTAVTPAVFTNRAVWNEYGLKESEAATYRSGDKQLVVTAYRLQDSTSAMAAFQWQRDRKAAPSKAAALAAETPESLLLLRGNYLLSLRGGKPDQASIDALIGGLRNVDTTALPTLPGFLPAEKLVPNSERYITGPVSLAEFFPGVPPSVAAFRMGAEAQSGVYLSEKGEMPLVLFNYPTQQLARQKVADFEKIPGAVVKRSGPLVAVMVSPPDPDAAEQVLSKVRYEAAVTLNEYVPTQRDNIGDLVINAFLLIGILIAFSAICGLFAGGFRTLLKRARKGEEPEPMICLHLERR
jgi:hypothetical protein